MRRLTGQWYKDVHDGGGKIQSGGGLRRLQSAGAAWLAAGTLVTGAAAGSVLHNLQSVQSPEQAAIVQVVRESQMAEQTLCLDPNPGMSAAQKLAQRATPAVVAAVQRNVKASDAAYYTGAQQHAQDAVVGSNCTTALTGVDSREIAGGIDDLQCQQILIFGDVATAACTENAWLTSVVTADQGTSSRIISPHDEMIVKDTLIRGDGGWRISREDLKYPPGQGP